jgi:hypothetical protein
MSNTKYTSGPWVQFADQGKCIAIMPAMREGDVCTFNQSPSDADARLIAAAPDMFKALEDAVPYLETLHSLLGMGSDARKSAFRIIKEARAALSKAAVMSLVHRPADN